MANDKPSQEKPDKPSKIEAENVIYNGQFGPATNIGKKGRIKADVIANTVQTSTGIDEKSIGAFLNVLEQLKTHLPDAKSQLDEYEVRDVERSMEVLEDHVNRPDDARDSNLIMQAIEKVHKVLAKVAPVAVLATQLWDMGKKLFGR